MGEFGHTGLIVGRFCIDDWGAGPFVISVGSKSWRFEDSDRFGPSLVKKNGDIREKPFPAEGSPFWRAHRIWVRQGRRTEDGMVCVWDEPKPTIVQHFGSRAWLVVQKGEPDGETIYHKAQP